MSVASCIGATGARCADADLAVLSSDYLTVPVAEIGGIRSLLTMVGGRVVYAASPYSDLEGRSTKP